MPPGSIFRLVTLGRLALLSPDGTEDDALNKRCRKLAVLSVLAIERRPIARDRLVEMFWGDQPEERARHSLSDALSHLRRLLGRESITLSRTEIALSPAAPLWVDANELTAAASAREHAQVIAAYGGAFLDGVFVPDSTTFEHWADRHRRRLEGLTLASCAARCAELARARRWEECAEIAARWLELEPASADAALFRLNALKAPGTSSADRRALDEFERLRARLRAELDLVPAAEVSALATSIANRLHAASSAPPPPRTAGDHRISPAPPSPVAENQAGPVPAFPSVHQRRRRWMVTAAVTLPLVAAAGFFLSGARRGDPVLVPDVVVVLPFTVHGDTAARYLRDGLVDLLATNLDGAGRLRAVDPRAVLAQTTPLSPTSVHQEQSSPAGDAKRVARRFGAGLLVQGDVVAMNGRLRIDAALYDAGDATTPRARAAVGGPSAELFTLVDDLTRQLLAGYRDPAPDGLTGLAALTTTSVPALKSYLDGVSAYRAGRFDDAVAAFRTAADEDTAFALAHYQLSNAMLWSARGSWESIVDESRAAVRHEARLGARARLLVEGHAAFRAGRFDEAERVYRRVVESYPDDVEGTYQYADLLFHGNGARGRSFTESRQAFEHVLGVEPTHLGALLHLVRIAMVEGRRAEADSLIGRASRLAPPAVRMELEALRAFAFGDSAARDRAVELLRTAPDEVVRVAAMRIGLFTRDLQGAARVARLLLAPSRAPEFRVVGRMQLADLALAEGRREVAVAQLDSARSIAPAMALEYKALQLAQPFVAVPRGELLAMRDTLRRWNAVVPPSRFPMFAAYNGIHGPIRRYLIGLLDIRLGDLADAERQAAALRSDRTEGEAGAFARGTGSALRGHILAERGELSAALQALDEGRLEVSEGLLDGPFGNQATERFARAEILRALGRMDEARAWYASLGYTSLDLVIYSAPVTARMAAIDRARTRVVVEPKR